MSLRATAALAAALVALPAPAQECRPRPAPAPIPESRSDAMKLDMADRYKAFDPIVVNAFQTRPGLKSGGMVLEIRRPDGTTWVHDFARSRAVPSADVEACEANSDEAACERAAQEQQPEGAFRLSFDVINQTGWYTAVVRLSGTRERVTHRFEVVAPVGGAPDCGDLPETLGGFKRVECSVARSPVPQLHANWGPRARYRDGDCEATAYVFSADDGVRLEFQENGVGLLQARLFPEGKVRAQPAGAGQLVAWMGKDLFLAVELPGTGPSSDRFVRALLGAKPPFQPRTRAVPKCATAASFGSHEIASESREHIVEKDSPVVAFEGGSVVGVELLSITEGWFFIRAGFRPGDVLLSIDDEALNSPKKVRAALGRIAAPGLKRVLVQRREAGLGCLELKVTPR